MKPHRRWPPSAVCGEEPVQPEYVVEAYDGDDGLKV
jgi:hypothetical protein